MLTATEIEKLKKFDRDKANDFIVRRKFKKWLDNLTIVSGYILRFLPRRQLRRLIERRHINNLISVLLQFLAIGGAVPIVRKSEHEYLAIVPNHPPREANTEEIQIAGELKVLIFALFQFLSVEDVRDVIQTEISRHHPEYTLMKREVEGKWSMDELLVQLNKEKEKPK